MIQNFFISLAVLLGFANLVFSYFLTKKIKNMGAKQDQIDSLIQRLDAKTTATAAFLKQLLDEIKNNSVSDASLAKLEQEVAEYEALGTNPTDPLNDGNTITEEAE